MVSIMEASTNQEQSNNNNNQRTGNMSSQQSNQRPGTGGGLSQRAVDIEVPQSLAKSVDNELAKRTLKLDLTSAKHIEEYALRSPKSPLSADGKLFIRIIIIIYFIHIIYIIFRSWRKIITPNINFITSRSCRRSKNFTGCIVSGDFSSSSQNYIRYG